MLINATPRQPEQQPTGEEVADNEPTERRTPFPDQHLLDAWKRYIAAHPQEQLVVGTMEMAPPVKVGEAHYEIMVASQGQMEFFESSKASVLGFLHDELNNDLLVIDVKLSPDSVEHKIWTPREVVEGLKQHNPGFNTFLADFQLGLA